MSNGRKVIVTNTEVKYMRKSVCIAPKIFVIRKFADDKNIV